MSSAEPARHALYSELERVLGPEHAETLMTHLPQHSTDEVATKADIRSLRADFESRFDRLEDRFDRLEDRMDRMQRFYIGTAVGSMTALTAIFTLAISLLG